MASQTIYEYIHKFIYTTNMYTVLSGKYGQESIYKTITIGSEKNVENNLVTIISIKDIPNGYRWNGNIENWRDNIYNFFQY